MNVSDIILLVRDFLINPGWHLVVFFVIIFVILGLAMHKNWGF